MAENEDRTEREEERPRDVTPDGGAISVSGDVIASIAGLAAAEVEGITTPRGEQFPKGEAAKRQVETVISEREVSVLIKVAMIYGYRVKRVAQDLQERIKANVERMTGLKVSSVNIEIVRLLFPEERAQEQEA